MQAAVNEGNDHTVNYALIFAGGTGQRMNSRTRPKQFLELHGKPIIIYTVEAFEHHPDIDGMVVVCLEDWIPFLKKKLVHYDIEKVCAVTPGGATGQESIRFGLNALASVAAAGDTVLVHDGVRPLVSATTISECVTSVEARGSAIASAPAVETVVRERNGEVVEVVDRSSCVMAKAPQCFRFGELLRAHERAASDGLDFIDSASLMRHYGQRLYTVESGPENIKITTPADFYTFRALVDARENSQILGI